MDARKTRPSRKVQNNNTSNTTSSKAASTTKGSIVDAHHTNSTGNISNGDNEEEIPVFIQTLIQIVHHPDTQHLCHWTSGGNTFIIEEPDG